LEDSDAWLLELVMYCRNDGTDRALHRLPDANRVYLQIRCSGLVKLGAIFLSVTYAADLINTPIYGVIERRRP